MSSATQYLKRKNTQKIAGIIALLVILMLSISLLEPVLINSNQAVLEFEARHGKYLVFEDYEQNSETSNKPKSTDYGLYLVTYADLEDAKDRLQINLSYSLGIEMNVSNRESNELVSSNFIWDSRFFNEDEFSIFISPSDVYQETNNNPYFIQENTTAYFNNGNETETKKYSIYSQSIGTSRDIDFYSREGGNLTFAENDFIFTNIGILQIESSDSINERVFLTPNISYSNTTLSYLDGKCIDEKDLIKCYQITSIIFRVEVSWLYQKFSGRTFQHQPYQFADFGDNIKVDPYISYIGFTGDTSTFDIPVYDDGYRYPIHLGYGSINRTTTTGL